MPPNSIIAGIQIHRPEVVPSVREEWLLGLTTPLGTARRLQLLEPLPGAIGQ